MIEQIIILIVISGPIIYKIIKYYVNNNYIIINASENIVKESNHILLHPHKQNTLTEKEVRSLRCKRTKQHYNKLKSANYIYTLPLENNQMSPRARQLYEKYGAIAIE